MSIYKDFPLIDDVSAMAYIQDVSPTGSAFTCNPPVDDTDIDWVVLTKTFDDAESLIFALKELAWCPDTKTSRVTDDNRVFADSIFRSCRRGPHNLIVTPHKGFYDKFRLATAVAKKLNLLDKSDRITLFQAILYGNSPTGFRELPK